jgi:hypothetical protein
MRFRLGVTLMAALLLGLAATAEAQREGGRRPGGEGAGGEQRGGPGRGGFGFGGGFGGFGGINRLGLLRIEAVQKELELTEEQLTAIQKLQEELRPNFGGDRGRRPGGDGERRRRGDKGAKDNNEANLGRSADFFVQQDNEGRRGRPMFTEEQLEEFRKQAEERAKQEREKLAAILLPNQVKRLNEIYIQVAGVNALNDAEVAKELEITDEQKEKFAKVREENGAAMRELFQPGGDREQAFAKMQELRKTGDEKLLAVLTDAQKAEFEEMKGEKFEMPEGAFGRGFGGRGGRRPGGDRPERDNQ